jgi:hypothetical protein
MAFQIAQDHIAVESLRPLPFVHPRTFSPLDIAEKAKKAGGELCHEHKQLISGLHGQYLYDRARCTKKDLFDLTGKVRLTKLTHLLYLFICFSTKFFWIAMNQIVLIRSRGEILTQAGFSRAVFDFFCFSGFALQILGAVFSVTYAHCNLRKTADTIHKVEYGVCGAVWGGRREYCVPRCNLPLRFRHDLRRLLYIMDHHSNVYFGLFLVFNATVVLNAMSWCILLITMDDSPESVVWVPLSVFIMVFLIVFVAWFLNFSGRTRRYWRKYLSYLAG